MPPPVRGCCAHDHDCSAAENDCSRSWSLYKYIDIPRVRCLNEAVEGSCRGVFKPWEQRLAEGPALASDDDDPELLLHIPFSGAAFINRDDLDFGMAGELPAVQEWELVENLGGQIEYPTQ
eukprot:scaffold20.g7810.t1